MLRRRWLCFQASQIYLLPTKNHVLSEPEFHIIRAKVSRTSHCCTPSTQKHRFSPADNLLWENEMVCHYFFSPLRKKTFVVDIYIYIYIVDLFLSNPYPLYGNSSCCQSICERTDKKIQMVLETLLLNVLKICFRTNIILNIF